MKSSAKKDRLLACIDKKEIIIFDFDGVLVDSVEIKSKAYYDLYRQYGKNIAEKVVQHHRVNGGMSRYDKFFYYHKRYLGKDIANTELDLLDEQFSSYVVNKVANANEIPGAFEFLNEMHTKKICYVCSATPDHEINKIVRLRGWGDLFKSVLGSPTSKFDNLQKILRHSNSSSNQVIFFGDAMADYEAAKDCNIDFIAVGNGWKEYNFTCETVGNIVDFNDLL